MFINLIFSFFRLARIIQNWRLCGATLWHQGKNSRTVPSLQIFFSIFLRLNICDNISNGIPTRHHKGFHFFIRCFETWLFCQSQGLTFSLFEQHYFATYPPNDKHFLRLFFSTGMEIKRPFCLWTIYNDFKIQVIINLWSNLIFWLSCQQRVCVITTDTYHTQ